MDVKRLIIGLAFTITLLLVLSTTLSSSKTEQDLPSVNLKSDLVTKLPEKWIITNSLENEDGSSSFYILTDDDLLLVLEHNTCKGLPISTTIPECLEENIQEYLPRIDLPESPDIQKSTATNKNLDGVSAHISMLNMRNESVSFVIEVYKIRTSDGPIFATISTPVKKTRTDTSSSKTQIKDTSNFIETLIAKET